MLNAEHKKQTISKFARSSMDSGSSEVQIGLLTERIKEIAEHLKLYPKDVHSQRGLILLVGKRRKLIKYLEKNDIKGYKRVMTLLDKEASKENN